MKYEKSKPLNKNSGRVVGKNKTYKNNTKVGKEEKKKENDSSFLEERLSRIEALVEKLATSQTPGPGPLQPSPPWYPQYQQCWGMRA